MFALKACPRCHRGDLYQDWQGEIVCIQCGYELPGAARTRFLAAVERPRQHAAPVMQAA